MSDAILTWTKYPWCFYVGDTAYCLNIGNTYIDIMTMLTITILTTTLFMITILRTLNTGDITYNLFYL
jgi:hypothetical protein